MTAYRIYETGNDTGRTWFYAKQKSLWFWVSPSLDELREPYDINDTPKRFDSKEELISAIKEAHEKKVSA